MAASGDGTQPAAAPPGGGEAPRPTAVDIARLAEKVYRLMQADARLAQARGQSVPRGAGTRPT
jgi:hypothetical protein